MTLLRLSSSLSSARCLFVLCLVALQVEPLLYLSAGMGLRGCLVALLLLPRLLLGSPHSSVISAMLSSGGAPAVIDEQLYSRQMLVHGAAAQARLAGAAVLVLGNGYRSATRQHDDCASPSQTAGGGGGQEPRTRGRRPAVRGGRRGLGITGAQGGGGDVVCLRQRAQPSHTGAVIETCCYCIMLDR